MPTDNFGPWTTSLTTGSRLELSALWKGRLDRLRSLNRARTTLSGTRAIAILWFGVSLSAAPLLDGALSPADAGAVEQIAPMTRIAEPRPAVAPAQRVTSALDARVEVNFIDAPLSVCLETLATYHKIAIEFDGMLPAKVEAIANTPMTLQCKGITVRSILKLFVDPLALDWYTDGERLIIAPVQNVDRRLEEWIYDVGDLERNGVKPAELIGAITGTADPESWKNVGGPGTIIYSDGELRVLQTRGVREQIDLLLSAVRRAFRGTKRQVDAAENHLVTRVFPIKELRDENVSGEQTASWIRDHFLPPVWKEYGGAAKLTVKGNELVVEGAEWVHEALNRSFPVFVDEFKLELQQRGVEHLSNLGRRSDWVWPALALGIYKEQAYRLALARRRSFDLGLVPLEDALKTIGVSDGLQFHFNGRELKNIEAVRKSITMLKVDGQPLSRILDGLLEPLGLDWFVLSESALIVITSPNDVRMRADSMELRVYRVQSLLAGGEDESNLMRRMIVEIEPDGWSAAGGPGTMQRLPGLLVVGARHQTHDKIEEWLNALERRPKP